MINIEALYLFLGGFTLFSFLLGAAAGWWLGVRAGKKRASKKDEKPVTEIPTRDPSEILRFVREKNSGALVMELRGKSIRRVDELSENERKNLARFGRDWLKWLGEEPPLPPSETTAPAAASLSPVQENPQSAAAETPLQPENALEMESAKTVYYEPQIQPDQDEPPAASGSIVEQINDILQDLLLQSPMSSQKIRLAEDPRQGVAVWIGDKCYPGVDGVPDQDVRALLRKAAQEWEKRSG